MATRQRRLLMAISFLLSFCVFQSAFAGGTKPKPRKKKGEPARTAVPDECWHLVEQEGKTVDDNALILEEVDEQIANFLLRKPFDFVSNSDFATKYPLVKIEIDNLIIRYPFRTEMRRRMSSSRPTVPSRDELDQFQIPASILKRLGDDPRFEKGYRPNVPSGIRGGAADKLPPMVEDAFEEAVEIWRGDLPTKEEKARFAMWFFEVPTDNSPNASADLIYVFREELFLESDSSLKEEDEPKFRFCAEFIFSAWKLGSRFFEGDHHDMGTAFQAIQNIGPLANKTPLEIHKRAREQGWSLPIVHLNRRLMYLWIDPELKWVAVLRLDQPWDKAHGVHVHKEVIPLSVLFERSKYRFLSYDPRRVFSYIYTDRGLRSADVVHIPVVAEMFPNDLLEYRRYNPNAPTDPTIAWELEKYFFPDIMSLPEMRRRSR